MNKISVEGIKGYGYHGCMDEEARIGQHYVVDVHMEIDFRRLRRRMICQRRSTMWK